MSQPAGRSIRSLLQHLRSSGLRTTVSIAICIVTIALALATNHNKFVLAGTGVRPYTPPLGIAIPLFAVLFAALSLLAFRLRRSVYVGFQHSAIVGTYLALGPVPALVTN